MKVIKQFAPAVGLALILSSFSCKRDDVRQPSPVGPSSIAHVLKVSASPNVIAAASPRQGTTITTTLKNFDGTGISNKTVFFEIGNILGNRVNVGFFEGNQSVLSRTTDGDGNISFVYYGPSQSEIKYNTSTVYIWGYVAMEGVEFITGSARVDIVKDP